MTRIFEEVAKFFKTFVQHGKKYTESESLDFSLIRSGESSGEDVLDIIALNDAKANRSDNEKRVDDWMKDRAREFELEKPFRIINVLSTGTVSEIEKNVVRNISNVSVFQRTFDRFRYIDHPDYGLIITPKPESEEEPTAFYVVGCSFTEFEFIICAIEKTKEAAQAAHRAIAEKISNFANQSTTGNYGEINLNDLRAGEPSFPLDITGGSLHFVDLRWHFRRSCFERNNAIAALRKASDENHSDNDGPDVRIFLYSGAS